MQQGLQRYQCGNNSTDIEEEAEARDWQRERERVERAGNKKAIDPASATQFNKVQKWHDRFRATHFLKHLKNSLP